MFECERSLSVVFIEPQASAGSPLTKDAMFYAFVSRLKIIKAGLCADGASFDAMPLMMYVLPGSEVIADRAERVK